MSKQIYIRFFQASKLGQENYLEQLIAELISAGFKISQLLVGDWLNIIAHWQEFRPEILKEIQIAYKNQQFSFHVSDTKSPVSLFVNFEWGHDSLANTITCEIFHTAIYFYDDTNPVHNSSRLLDCAKVIYSETSPVFGWVERCAISGYTNLDDIRNFYIPHIYWANFYGPEYIEKIGDEKILKAPGWKVEPLGDGGYLYVLFPKIGGRRPAKLKSAIQNYFDNSTIK